MKLRELTVTQTAALQAALFPDERALPAWAVLSESTGNLDRLDHPTFRMLPAVYRNLRNMGLEESELGPLKGVYRQWWVKSRLTIQAALRAIGELRAAGVEPVALKGLGLIATAYPEAALRPMVDADLLVRPSQFEMAAGVLMDGGWTATRGSRADFFRRARVFHAMPVVAADGTEIDLHHAILEENTAPGSDARAWSRTVTAEVQGVSITTLSPEDHLINACIHGARWDWTPALRWVIDAVYIVRGTPELDWGYVEAEARRRGITLALGQALARVAEFADVPVGLTDRLSAARHSWLERADFRAQQALDRPFPMAARSVTRYLRTSRGRSPWRRAEELPTYYEWIWELDRPRQVPGEALRRTWRRLKPG